MQVEKKVLYSAYAKNDDKLIYSIKYEKTKQLEFPSGKGTGSNLVTGHLCPSRMARTITNE
jgi:hypothetical protein